MQNGGPQNILNSDPSWNQTSDWPLRYKRGSYYFPIEVWTIEDTPHYHFPSSFDTLKVNKCFAVYKIWSKKCTFNVDPPPKWLDPWLPTNSGWIRFKANENSHQKVFLAWNVIYLTTQYGKSLSTQTNSSSSIVYIRLQGRLVTNMTSIYVSPNGTRPRPRVCVDKSILIS